MLKFLSFSSRRTPDRELPLAVYGLLIESLYKGSRANLAATLANCVLAAFIVAGDYQPTMRMAAGMLAVSCVVRIAAAVRHILTSKRPQTKTATREETTRREHVFLAVGCAFSLSLGMLGYFAIVGPIDENLRFAILGDGLVFAMGQSARSAASPRVVAIQLLLSIGPFITGEVVVGGASHYLILTLMVFMCAAVRDTTRSLNGTLVGALLSHDKASENADRFNTALSNMRCGLMMVSRSGRVSVANSMFMRTMGTTSDPTGEFAAAVARTTVAPLLGTRAETEAVAALFAGHRGGELDVRTLDGRTLEFTSQPMQHGWLVTVDDVTEKRAAQDVVERMARNDAVTGLPNRRAFMEAIEKRIADKGEKGPEFAILSVDLDRFKEVNDTLGHQAGDDLLRAVAERMRCVVGESGFVARFGGDEFMVLLPTPDRAGVAATGAAVVRKVGESYQIGANAVAIGASVGAAMFPADAENVDAESLMKSADMALYDAKASGRGTLKFFVEDMAFAVRRRRKLAVELREAVANGEIDVEYQPIVDAATGRTTAVETLARWSSPTKGKVSPTEFIPIAEETGSIMAIGEWVLRQACRDAAAWPRHIRVAVNVSALQFGRGDIVRTVRRALADAGISADRLELEITESTLIGNHDATLEKLKILREMGVKVALDDFGTGYSSLSYLTEYIFDKIKIDRGFVREISGHGAARATTIINAVVGIAKGLNMTTVVEGVETNEEFAILRGLGVKEIQGYLFSRPVSAADLGLRLLKETAAAGRTLRLAPPVEPQGQNGKMTWVC